LQTLGFCTFANHSLQATEKKFGKDFSFSPTRGIQMAIVAKRLTKKFGDLIATDRVSFEVAEGEVFGLLGPNGAGKTTLVRILSTLLRPDAGEAKIAGFDVTKEAKAVRRNLGIISDGMAIYEHLTPSENLEFFGTQYGMDKKDIRARGEDLFAVLDLTDFKNTPVKVFSTGMKRKAEIAVALVHDPPVLLSDEVTAGLDPQMSINVRNFFRDLAQKENKTVLWTTHYLTEPELICDQIGILFKGQLVANGTIQELKEKVSTSADVSAIHCMIPDDTTLSLIEKNWPQVQIKVSAGQLEILANWEQSNAVLRFLIASGIPIYRYQPMYHSQMGMEEIFIALCRSQLTNEYL
jgi:ABC-type multidrug transport system ATPase subunit